MVGEVPLVVTMAGVFAAHALLAWLLGRRMAGDRRAGAARIDREAGVVECAECGATNGLDYRFCRNCVAELPAATGSVDAPAGPVRRDLN